MLLQQQGRQVMRRTDSRQAKAQLGALLCGLGQKLVQCFDPQLRRHGQHENHVCQSDHRNQAAQGVNAFERKLRHMRVHGDLQIAEHAQQGTVGCAPCNGFHGNVARCARSVFHHHGRACAGPQPFRGGTGNKIRHAANRIAHQEAKGAP